METFFVDKYFQGKHFLKIISFNGNIVRQTFWPHLKSTDCAEGIFLCFSRPFSGLPDWANFALMGDFQRLLFL
jgi:hypothetical protein